MMGVPAAHLELLFGAGFLLYLLSAGLHYAALAGEASREAALVAAEARALARDAELHALRMQINPHFLFNSLHSIAALATVDGLRAREMCIRLSDFLRSSLGLGERENVPLREELALARSYLEVEQVRFGARLHYSEDIEESCQDCAVPVLLLQPLVENAVKHGIAGLVGGGAIRLAAERRDHCVWVSVENGFDVEGAAADAVGRGPGAGSPAVGTALRRCGRDVRLGERRGLPGGVAIPLRIAHGLQQPGIAGPADRQAGTVGQNRDAALFAVRFDARHAFQVDDGGAVDADEGGGVEEGLEGGNGLLLQIAFGLAVERHVVILCDGVIQFGDGDDVHAGAVLDDDAMRAFAGGPGLGGDLREQGAAFAEPRAATLQRPFEALGAEGLEEVIDGMGVERAHGVLIVGGDENDDRSVGGLDQFEDFKAIELGHLDVEKEEVWGGFGDGLYGLEAVAALGDDFDFGVGREQFAQIAAGEFFVIDQRGFNCAFHRKISVIRYRAAKLPD